MRLLEVKLMSLTATSTPTPSSNSMRPSCGQALRQDHPVDRLAVSRRRRMVLRQQPLQSGSLPRDRSTESRCPGRERLKAHPHSNEIVIRPPCEGHRNHLFCAESSMIHNMLWWMAPSAVFNRGNAIERKTTMPRVYKPGENAPVSGEYEIVGTRGGETGRERTSVQGRPLPPTPKPGQGYVVNRPAHNGAGRKR